MAKRVAPKTAKSGKKSTKKGKGNAKMTPLSAALLLGAICLALFLGILCQGGESAAEPTAEVVEQSENTAAEASKPSSSSQSSSAAKSDTPKKEESKKDAAANASSSNASAATPSNALRAINYEKTAQPELERAYSSVMVDHMAYRLSYNAEYKVPNWVFYELTLAETLGNMKRSNDFQADPSLPVSQAAQLTDYRNSGYDRGHMAPSADMNWDADVMSESYYLSNMCPQGHDFNAGTWLDLENLVRTWAERDSAVVIACGPVLPYKDPASGKLIDPVTRNPTTCTTIGKGKVLVPEWFYKVVLSPFGTTPKAIAFVMPNRNEKNPKGRGNRPISEYAVTVDSVERLTGIDFFSILPDDIEDRIESHFDLKAWF